MPSMRACRNYTKLCSPGTAVQECANVPMLTNLPKTKQLASQVYSICTEMYMDGCSSCNFNSPTSLPNCDILGIYSKLCIEMPGMPQCSDLTTICSSTPSLTFCNGYPIFSPGFNGTLPVSMLMYFHNQPAYVLFTFWVPRSTVEYIWTYFLLVVIGIVSEALVAGRIIIEHRKLTEVTHISKFVPISEDHSVESSSISSLTSNRPLIALKESKNRVIFWVMTATVVRYTEILLHYLLMLAAMSFNVIVFFAVVT
ncbi:hypothetical protein HK096_006600, partial [Nowakowskiella sp. JEL0078]